MGSGLWRGRAEVDEDEGVEEGGEQGERLALNPKQKGGGRSQSGMEE